MTAKKNKKKTQTEKDPRQEQEEQGEQEEKGQEEHGEEQQQLSTSQLHLHTCWLPRYKLFPRISTHASLQTMGFDLHSHKHLICESVLKTFADT